MHTQVLGSNNIKAKCKPIKVHKFLDGYGEWQTVDANTGIDENRHCTLICESYISLTDEGGHDMMLFHNTDNPSKSPADTLLCLGYWNDGVFDHEDYLP